jgi:hypothetical protein
MNVYPLELENRITDIEGVKHAIIISGDSKEHLGYQTTYLFIVPEEGTNLELFKKEIEDKLKGVLLEEELPEQIHMTGFSLPLYALCSVQSKRRAGDFLSP